MKIDETHNLLTLRSILPKGPNDTPKSHKKGLFECVCGQTKQVRISKVKSGHTKSCGCISTNAIGSKHIHWTGHGDISGRHLSKIKYDAKIRGYAFDLTIEYLWDLYVGSGRRCVYSGFEIDFNYAAPKEGVKSRERRICTASLDRIDSKLGYVVGNVQWVHKIINFMKQAMSEEEFLKYVEATYNYKIKPTLKHIKDISGESNMSGDNTLSSYEDIYKTLIDLTKVHGKAEMYKPLATYLLGLSGWLNAEESVITIENIGEVIIRPTQRTLERMKSQLPSSKEDGL